ncbi:MAG: NADP-dependent malic enzyme [Kiritimatiellae bacterium]|nr:NADP-dependent malic enzyme [Kiritimatiellia bacterium]
MTTPSSSVPPPGAAARADEPARQAMRLHPFYRGKIETGIKCAVRSMEDFAIWYSPGVAAPCRAIAADPAAADEHTNRWNTVAVVSDGSRVLGLGDIGPLAALPVMEGKALLFKYLGGVDAVPLVVDVHEPESLVRLVLAVQPSFGGINLEDIAQPKCFEVLDRLRAEAAIPVWHDDQQGTATVILAGLINALKVVGKRLEEVRIAFIGAGASNTAAARLAFAAGADPARCRVVDRGGILGRHRSDIARQRGEYAAKWRLCEMTNADGATGGAAEAIEGADVVIACSTPGPGTIRPEWVRRMREGAIVFACANPVPEIWPWEAAEAGVAVFATGRSDFPNQVNNSLCFPGLFRGVLDVRATTITDGMCLAAARSLAESVGSSLRADRILPTMEDWEVFPAEAAAVAMQAQAEGVARRRLAREEAHAIATATIRRARAMAADAMRLGHVPLPP